MAGGRHRLAEPTPFPTYMTSLLVSQLLFAKTHAVQLARIELKGATTGYTINCYLIEAPVAFEFYLTIKFEYHHTKYYDDTPNNKIINHHFYNLCTSF